MREPVKITIDRDDGESIAIGEGTDWRIPADGLEGWATLPLDVGVMEAANLDGGFVQRVRVGSADRTITAALIDAASNEVMRPRVIHFFSPKHRFTVHVEYQGLRRWCEGVQAGFKCSEGRVTEPITFTWTLLSPQPFLLSEDDFGKDLAAISGRFGFPQISMLPTGTHAGGVVQLKTVTGFVTGVHDFGKNMVIENTGDVPSPFAVRIRARGDVVNPKVIKAGRFVRVLTKMRLGQELVIDFQTRPPKVTLDGANVLNLCDRASSFTGMELDLGKNQVSYGADSGEQSMSVSLFWRKMYLGV